MLNYMIFLEIDQANSLTVGAASSRTISFKLAANCINASLP